MAAVTAGEQGLLVRSVEELIGCCVALGALSCGGPLSDEERRVAASARPWRGDLDCLGDSIRAGADPLGETYLRLRATAERRRLGAFYTPPPVVRAMVEWALAAEPERLVDAGCGSGRFSAAAVRARPELPVTAVDLDPIATFITRAVLACVGGHGARVLQADYPGTELRDPSRRTAFVANPPYVRHHDLDGATKDHARRLAERHGLPWSGLAGLHVHFFLATLEHARPGDVGTFITSAEWLDVNYGGAVRQALIDGLGGESVHLLDHASTAFEDAMTTAVITCFRVGRSSGAVRLRPARGLAELCDLDSGGRLLGRDQLAESSRWTPLFHHAGPRPAAGSGRLGDWFRVSRGVATGHNAFFVLSAAEVAGWHLEPWSTPVLTRAREVLDGNGVVRVGDCKYLLDPPRGLDLQDPASAPLRRYLATGERAGVAERYLCRSRHPWWHLGAKSPPIVATYMARQPPAFALNPDGMRLLNVCHGLYPRRPMTEAELAAVVAHLNDHRASFAGASRTYHGGLQKFEPGEMEALPMPAPEELLSGGARG